MICSLSRISGKESVSRVGNPVFAAFVGLRVFLSLLEATVGAPVSDAVGSAVIVGKISFICWKGDQI